MELYGKYSLALTSASSSWHQAKRGTALQLCVQVRETAVLSLPATLGYVFNQELLEAGLWLQSGDLLCLH